MTTATSAARALMAAGATDVGRLRDVNEDRLLVDVERGTFIVVDGIGGQAAGETAAETAIAAMRERLSRRTGTLPDRIREAITIANNEIHRLASTRPDWRGMACVLTVAVVEGGRATIGHVGDSRLYRLRGSTIEKITPDHSPVGEREDAQEISELEAMRHPRRNEVYRDVGSEPHAIGDTGFVFVTEIDLPPDAALLLCSDGLTDLVPSETIRRIAATHAGSPEAVVGALIDAANEAGGKDNITAVFVQGEEFAVHTTDRFRPGPGRPRRRRLWALPALVALLAVAVLAAGLSGRVDGWPKRVTVDVLTASAGAIVVLPSESIAAAIAEATPGSVVIVEPGEYRERIALKDNVRVVSRVPRAAVLRLPGLASDQDAAVVAAGVTNAELAGFRIVGDASTPLGIGVLARDAALRLIDIDVTGAITAALDLGAGTGVTVVGSEIHDNPGSALAIRPGAQVRLSHNVFARNALSDRVPAVFLIEPDADVVWSRNVLHGIRPEAIAGTDAARRSSLLHDNWFVAAGPETPARPAGGRGARGR